MTWMCRIALTATIALFATTVARGQTLELKRSPMPVVQAFVRYSEQLPDSHVLAITQDANGFLWIGSQEGALTRFDGYRYLPVKSGNEGIRFVTALLATPNGRVWIATGEHGLQSYDPATDMVTPETTFHQLAKIDQDSALTALFAGPNDILWVGTADGKVVRYDAANQTAKNFSVAHTPIADLFADKTGRVWIATGDGLFSIENGQENATASPLKQGASVVSSVLVDHAGNLWVGTDEGLFRRDPAGALTTFTSDEKSPARLVDNHVTRLLEDRAHNLWIGTAGGVSRLQPGANAFTNYVREETNAHSIPHVNVTAAFEDRDGGIWFGFFDLGMARFSAEREKLGLRRLPKIGASSFWEEPDKSYWVGTYPGSLVHVSADETTFEQTSTLTVDGEPDPLVLDSNWVTAIRRRGDILWVATDGEGLLKINLVSGAVHRIPECGSRVFGLALADRHIFAATWGEGLVRIELETGTVDLDFVDSEHLYTVEVDRSDRNVVWVGSAKDGLLRVDVAGKTAKALIPPGEHRGVGDIVSIFQQPNGGLWLGTYGAGVFHFDPATKAFAPLSASPILRELSVLGVVEDRGGHVWFTTTSSGLFDVDPKTDTFRQFLETDGVQHREFAQNSIHLGASGRLLIGGKYGYNAFTPATIGSNKTPLKLSLTGFRIMGEPAKLSAAIWRTPSIELGPKDNLFSIEFSAFQFEQGATYAYEIPGIHSWVETNEGHVSYSRLPHGDYTFRVRAKGRGDWSEPVEIELVVAPPFYRTTLAYIIYAILGAGIVAGLLWYARQRLRSVEQKSRLQALQKDLDLTAAVQNGFLPETPHFVDNNYIGYGTYRPAATCSGDWWWIEQDADRVVALVGDVTGHGPGPAMVTAAVCSAFRGSANQGLSLRDRIDLLNNEVLKSARGQLQMTVTAVEINFRTRTYDMYFAGGLPVIVLLDNRPARPIIAPSTPLGSTAFTCAETRGEWTPGIRFVLMTDGIPEVQTSKDRLFGIRRICQLLDANSRLPPEPLVNHIVDQALQYVQTEQADDWTMVMIAHRA